MKETINNATVNPNESSTQKHTSDSEEEQVKRFKDLFSDERESEAKLDCINGKESYQSIFSLERFLNDFVIPHMGLDTVNNRICILMFYNYCVHIDNFKEPN